ncbi:glycoside hydrolase family 2 [Saccharobesus litoralis]|uniref:Glycoside hydrolase family 2 n=1 Tax=Saccharobesus litoralis TaxID=2172099 RepID=A0A2S0VVI2_9ALTE|nr:glycoside hydrolase family 2 TIM barrel-domain containing protein [Saccharobesus litoralis]AWB68234.1 glycoside hydrolase family 2 [Saccharobesus litoralis]
MRSLIIVTLITTVIFGCSKQQPSHDVVNDKVQSKALARQSPQQIGNFNQAWLFNLADDKAYSTVQLDDKNWRALSLPHDWSIEQDFDQKWNGATGYLPGGIAWYRKHFKTPGDLQEQLFVLNFDGIYNHSTIWLNGVKIGGEVNGYTPFNLELNPHLKPEGQNNVLAIRVDHSRYIDSRWYTGSGIYRDVTLYRFNKLHIPVWGTYVTTPKVTHDTADINLAIELSNQHNLAQSFKVITDIIDPNQQVVATQSQVLTLQPKQQQTIEQHFTLSTVQLWDTSTPNLYTAHSRIVKDQQTIGSRDTRFGLRFLEFNPDKGFFLNGQHTLIKGVNLHHDAGLVGVAVPDDVWRRRLTRLKQAGVNAIRTAHNPASARFLELCDEMGLLVQAEIFDEWDNPKDKRLNQQERHDDYISRGYADWFQTHAEADLKAAMKRDRNHPSIIMWSIGNEIEWTYPRYKQATGYFDMNAAGNYFFNPPFISPEEIKQRFHNSEEGQYVLAKTAKKLSNWVKQMDTTRPVTANLILPSVSHISGYTDALDIIGYSYRRVIYDYGYKLFPGKMVMGHENVPQWHEWQAVIERPFVAGTFLWTGTDYLGESHKRWPTKAVRSGLLNLAGFENPSYHMFKSLWNNEPHIHLTTQTLDKSPYKLEANKVVEKKPGAWQQYVWYWYDVNQHWNYQAQQMTVVEAYTNCQQVELFSNGQSLGVQTLQDNADHILKWAVPYQAGQLTAKGLGNCQTTTELHTASEVSTTRVQLDKNQIAVDQNQVVHIDMQLVDAKGHAVTHKEHELTVTVSPELHLLGTDNGRPDAITNYKANTLPTYQGRALAIVTGIKPGTATVKISGPNIATQMVKINVISSSASQGNSQQARLGSH